MKKLISLLLVFTMVFALAGCTSDNTTPSASVSPSDSAAPQQSGEPVEADGIAGDRNDDGEVIIAYSAIAYNIAVLPQYLYDFLKTGCEERGWTFLPLAAEGDAPKQGEQIQQLIQQDPDYFILFPADPELAVDWAKDIANAGIPCITLHTDVGESGQQYVDAYCGPDNYTMAADIAKALVDKNGADAGLKIVEIGGIPVQSDYIQRVAGFDDYIKANSNYEILGLEWAGSSRADAKGYMENFISAYGDQINVLMGFDDDLTLGGVGALQEAGMTDVEVYSITGQIEAIAAIKAGTMTLSAYYSTEDTVAEAFSCIEALIAGKPIEYFHYTNVPHITAENADEFVGEF